MPPHHPPSMGSLMYRALARALLSLKKYRKLATDDLDAPLPPGSLMTGPDDSPATHEKKCQALYALAYFNRSRLGAFTRLRSDLFGGKVPQKLKAEALTYVQIHGSRPVTAEDFATLLEVMVFELVFKIEEAADLILMATREQDFVTDDTVADAAELRRQRSQTRKELENTKASLPSRPVCPPCPAPPWRVLTPRPTPPPARRDSCRC